jgi:PAS domain S-box-containing protein
MRVLIVDDHEVVRRGVRSLVLSQNKYEICGEAVDGQDAVEKAQALHPDVIVMDVTMPRLNGLEATRLLRHALPDCEVLILSQHESPEMARQAMNAGARGYVAKRSIAKDLLAALEKVSRHEPFFDPSIWGGTAASSDLDIQEILQRSAAFEQALRESEQLYRSTFELAAVGVAHVRPDGRWLRVNRKLCEIVGYSETELMQLTFQEITHPEDLPADLAETEKLLNGSLDMFSMQKRYIRKDGTPVWVSMTVSVARDVRGKPKHFISVVEDIHERREAGEVRARLAAIVESSDDAIISKDLDGVVLSWNAGAVRIFEFTAAEAVGKSITFIIPSERRHEEEQILRRLRKGERIEHFETVRVTKSGKRIDVSLTISPVRNIRGQVIGVSKIARDITAQKQVEESLRESEERFRAIFETTPECVKLVAPDGTLLHMNSPGLKMVGADGAAAVVGASVYDLVAPEDRDRFRSFNRRICSGEKGSLEFDIVGLEGRRLHVETHAAPLRNPDGRTVQLAVTRDVTERKQAEAALRLQRERFELMTQASQVGFWFCDLPFDKLTWDAKVKEHFWLPADADVSIDVFFEQIHPDDRERTRQTITDCIEKDIPYEIEYRTVALDGRERWIRAMGRAFYDSTGTPKSFDGLTFDITDRKQAEERERQMTAETIAATAKFRAVFEQTTVFAGIISKDGTVIEANKMSLDACGYRAEDVLGKLFWETPWWRNSQEAQDKIRAATPLAAQGIPCREMLHYSWADGTERLVDFALYPILDDNEQVIFLHPTGVDITDVKRTEENFRKLAETLDAEVRARTKELEDRNADALRQSEQVRDLSMLLMRTQDHERRHIARDLHDSAGQTLTVLGINLAQLIQSAKRAAPAVAKEGEKIQELVQQLHQEIRTTSYLLHPPLLDETGLRSALSWYAQGLGERSGLAIDLTVTEDLGRLPADMELAIFRLVQESLTNVHRHSGSKTARIRISREAGEVRIEVHDQGQGIEPSRLAQIQTQGSGLGIRGLRERLRQFNGDIKIESNGSGTSIVANIPLPQEDEPADEEPLQSAAI